MALEYSIYPQYITGLTLECDTLVSGSSSNYVYYSLDAVEKIADALGDGFYAEIVTNSEGIPIYWASNSTTILVDGNKSLPVLRHSKYGNVCIFFYANTGSAVPGGVLNACVFDVVARKALVCCQLHTSGTSGETRNNTSLCIVNVSPTRKMICAGGPLQSVGNIVLSDYIILNKAESASGSPYNIACIKNDGTKSETTYSAALANRTRVDLLPFFAEGFPDAEFPGIYVIYRTVDNRSRANFSYGGVLYFSPGSVSGSTSTLAPPVLVISDE